MSGERGAYDVDEHHLSVAEVCERYGTAVDLDSIATSKGLTAEEAAKRLEKYGRNMMSPPKDLPEIVKFLKQFTNPLMALLVIAGAFTYMAYGLQSPKDSNNLILASALILVVTATCIMSYFQERSANNVMNSLKKMMPQKCMVTRDGKEFKVDVGDLVPGDLVRLYIGDRVPADIRIIQTSDLKVECSSLTGESDLVPASVDKKHDQAAEARNIIFMSSLCMNGEGRGIVVRTGDNTFIGKIASLASETAGHRTTMAIEVHRLVMFVGALAFVMGLAFFFIGLGRHPHDALTAFVNGFILVIVANVPEGLPATVTSCLTLTALRLKERNVLIKKTDIVENLGVATIIASDKTGTLTQNKMTVENVWTNLELRPANTLLPATQALNTVSTAGSGYLGRLSRLSRRSRGPGSGALGRTSAKASNLGRSSRQAGAIQLAKVSVDPTTGMSIGRSMVPKGDGTIEASPSKLGAIEAGNQQTLSTFSMQAFADVNAVSWDKSSSLTKLVTISTVCNRAKFSGDDGEGAEAPTGAVSVPMFQSNAERKILGDATDSGLLRYGDRMAPSAVMRMAYPKLHEIPFNSANKWALVVTQAAGNPKQHLVMMKGAPEIVLTKCSHYLHNNVEKPIDDDFRAAMTGAYERCGFMGERVLGFAYKLVPAKNPELYQNSEGTEHAPPTSGLVFMGLISLVDPPREGVKEAVFKCRSAGIRVAMVTGDHPLTAEAIARKVGIITLQTAREVAAEAGVPESAIARGDERVGAIVVTGGQLREVKTEEEWDTILEHPEIVFARTSPQQKLQIVENLQRLKEVVAVTGDGVNDSPALKKAQIGVSMGSANASDVAREAADIVLLDDEFKSIVVAIEEGRVIYDNLKKTIAYTLTHALPEVFPIFLSLALGFPMGLGGLLILSIDLLTEQGPAISLAYEHAEANVMERPPRDIEHDRLISGALLRYSYLIAGVFEAWICMVGFFAIFLWYHIPISKVIWGIDDHHFDYKDDKAAYLRLKCKTEGGIERCKHNFDPHRQTEIWRMAQTCWYVTLVMCQFWHIWVCKTRQVSIFTHGLFRNYVTIVGTAFSILVVIIITYIPALHSIFDTESLIGIGWLPNLMFLIFILSYSELSKYFVRKDPDSWWAHYMQW